MLKLGLVDTGEDVTEDVLHVTDEVVGVNTLTTTIPILFGLDEVVNVLICGTRDEAEGGWDTTAFDTTGSEVDHLKSAEIHHAFNSDAVL
jgi:hypothetical protein